jgi:hypothetical protein
LRRHQGSKFGVGNDFHRENRLAALNFVAVGEHRLVDSSSIEESAVAALAILDAVALRRTLDGEVHAGHERIVRKGKLRAPGRSPDEQSMAREERDFLTGKRTGFDFENDSHRPW